MIDPENEAEHIEVFKSDFKEGLDELLDNAEILLDIPRPPDPVSMGFDERTIEELGEAERIVVKGILFERLGIDHQQPDKSRIREYITQTPPDTKFPGEIKVSVYRTTQEEEGIYLQELTFPDGEKRWVIGPNQNI